MSDSDAETLPTKVLLYVLTLHSVRLSSSGTELITSLGPSSFSASFYEHLRLQVRVKRNILFRLFKRVLLFLPSSVCVKISRLTVFRLQIVLARRSLRHLRLSSTLRKLPERFMTEVTLTVVTV